MKVYIVTDGEYSDYHIEAVFDDRKKAELHAALHNCNCVEEYDVNDCKIEGNTKYYVVHYIEEGRGGELYVDNIRYSTKREHGIETHRRSEFFGSTIRLMIRVSLEEHNEERALKIAQDMYAMYKAAKEGL